MNGETSSSSSSSSAGRITLEFTVFYLPEEETNYSGNKC